MGKEEEHGYIPPQGQYPPPQGQYPPQGYPPQGYEHQYPPQGQYPPPQGQYPPPQGQYPPPQGYAPQAYPLQHYPPQEPYPNQPQYAAPYAQPPPQPQQYNIVSPQYAQPPPPVHPPVEDPKRFPKAPKYRDLPFVILFLLHLGGVGVVMAFAYMKDDPEQDRDGDGSSSSGSAADFIPYNKLGRIFACCLAGAGAAFLFAVLWLAIMKKFARQLIIFTMIASIVWCVVLAIVSFHLGSVAGGIVFIIIAILTALFFWFARSRIPFATAVLKAVAGVLQSYPAPTYYAYGSLIVQAAWLVVWITAFTWVQKYESGPAAGLMIFLIFSFYWTAQVIKNVVHVTSSGLFATWYFLSGTAMPSSPTHKSFKRAMTTSFGSICLGSLLVAILKTLRTLVDSLRRENNGILICLASCILGILDRLLQYFNMYAFAQIAIYGKRYCKAAKDTWHMFESKGMAAIINDNLISGVLTLGAILGGASAAFVGALIASVVIDDYWFGIGLVCFLLGISLVMITMEVVESGVCTIFVCFAMDPHALERNNAELYTKFVTTYKGINV